MFVSHYCPFERNVFGVFVYVFLLIFLPSVIRNHLPKSTKHLLRNDVEFIGARARYNTHVVCGVLGRPSSSGALFLYVVVVVF